MKIADVDKKMVASNQNSNDITYYNPKDDDRFKVEGLAFFKNEKVYHRLSKDDKENVREVLYWLASHPSGGQIRFTTNAKKIYVKVKNTGDYMMCHMTKTGQQGVDLYFKRKQDRKYQFFTCAKFNAPCNEYESIVFEADYKEEKQIIINLPLYEGLDEILIGIESDAYIKKAKEKKNKGKIVVYGTSVTQGGCASRPGMAYYNILSRWLDIEIINLGFSGNGWGDIELAHVINKINDVNMVILEYEGNGADKHRMKYNLEPFIDTIRNKNPEIPILLITKRMFPNYIFKQAEIDLRNYYYNFQKEMVLKKKNEGDNNIYFIDGSYLFGKKDYFECCVDGIHPTDLGFYKMAKTLYPKLKKILKDKK